MVTSTSDVAESDRVQPSIAIIGLGSRGVGVLERLVSHCLSEPYEITVHLVDGQAVGPGIHRTDQPDYLLLNTVCSQLTAFADPAMVDGPARLPGPSLHEWARGRDLRLAEDGYTVRAGTGRRIQPNDFLPRRLLGGYLAWAAQRILAAAPPCLRLVRHRVSATGLESVEAGERVVLDDGTRFTVNSVFLTIGHHGLRPPTRRDADSATVGCPYPLPERLEDVRPDERVLILGMGLTAMDVIASLTVGRGGRHVAQADGASRYLPGGAEPEILLASRSGLPSRSRPVLNPGRIKPDPLALTPARLEELRGTRRDGRLNLAEDVLPLVEAEMDIAFYRACRARQIGDPQAAGCEFAQRAAVKGIRALIAEAGERFGPSPVHGLLSSHSRAPASWPTYSDYVDWFTASVADDLVEARAGLGVSPLKEALEVLRDNRDMLRAVVDNPGIDQDSSERFFDDFASTVNRLVIGPQLERSVELLALIEAGIVHLAPGSHAEILPSAAERRWVVKSTTLAAPRHFEVDRVIAGHLHEPAQGAEGSLVSTLLKSGRLCAVSRRSASGPGLEVTRDGRAVDATGAVQQRVFLLGQHTEGSSYYNHYIPSPGAPSRALRDAELALRTALPDLAACESRPLPQYSYSQ